MATTDRRETESGIEIAPVYTADDAERELELPGEFPFTRGPYRDMYRGRPWTIRQYAGFASAEENVDFFRTYYGPTLRAFETLDPARGESLRSDLLALARRYDRNGGTGPIAITADYLESVIVRK